MNHTCYRPGTEHPAISSQGQSMSQDMIWAVPHTSSIVFIKVACTLQTRADLSPGMTNMNTAECRLWPNHTSKTALTLEEFVSLVDSSDFYSSNTLLCSKLILRPLRQYALPAILVCVKHWYSFKKISLPFSGLHSHTFRKLFEPTDLSFSNLLFLHTHRVLSSSASNHKRQKIHNHCGTTGIRNTQKHTAPLLEM